jgi:hypothetical protein
LNRKNVDPQLYRDGHIHAHMQRLRSRGCLEKRSSHSRDSNGGIDGTG